MSKYSQETAKRFIITYEHLTATLLSTIMAALELLKVVYTINTSVQLKPDQKTAVYTYTVYTSLNNSQKNWLIRIMDLAGLKTGSYRVCAVSGPTEQVIHDLAEQALMTPTDDWDGAGR